MVNIFFKINVYWYLLEYYFFIYSLRVYECYVFDRCFIIFYGYLVLEQKDVGRSSKLYNIVILDKVIGLVEIILRLKR